MKLYQIIFAVMALFSSNIMLSQSPSLKGRLYDQKKESIPFATVALINPSDSTVVTGTMSDIEGHFDLRPNVTGVYYLRFSAIGYSSTHTSEFEITDSSFSKDFGNITLEEEITMLNEVVIKALRPQVQAENGKIVMRVAGSSLASGNSAYQMLTQAPGVSTTQNGDFQINGKNGVAVMIDGRPTYFSSDELKTLLENMPAEDIENIEVITSPSAKYDAEGNAGILNITLKKNSLSGINGSVYGGIKVGQQTLFNSGVNLNYKKGKWNSFLNIDASQRGMVRDAFSYRTFPDISTYRYYSQDGVNTSKRFVPSFKLGTDYTLNERHSLGIMGSFSHQNHRQVWNLKSLGMMNNNTSVDIDAKNHMDESIGNTQINLHYTGKPDTLGTRISADIDYVRLNKESESQFKNQYWYSEDGSDPFEALSNESNSDYDIYAARIDFSMPLSSTSTLETGVKASKVISNSALQAYLGIGEGSILDPDGSNDFRYEEDIFAGYVSYSNRINDTWNIQGGLRIEQTKGKGQSFILDQTNNKDYLNLFPNVSIEQQVSDNYKLNYSFSKRITRPDYKLMNPFLFYLDPNTSIVGNPDIQPQISNSFKLGQTFLKKYNLILSYDYNKNYMAELPSTNPTTGKTTLSIKNLNYFKSYNATIIAPIKLASFWQNNNTLVLTQQNFELDIDNETLKNIKFFYMWQTNHQINLPSDFKFELNAVVKGPAAYGIYDVTGQWWIDAGIKRSFMDNKLNVSLKASEIFRSMDMTVDATYGGNYFNLKQYFWQQAISLSLRYNFNNSNKEERNIRKNHLEEINRAGGN